ncbi:MAG: cell division protein FtsZ, partial [Gammaproteobacteria bacterium]|nr:cell division protein FtsZ [Gammaproteobacteria bacterium]
LRVTVVATGIGRQKVVQQKHTRPISHIKKTDGDVDYKALDRPAIIRHRDTAEQFGLQDKLDLGSKEDYDVPAFLRRQAD